MPKALIQPTNPSPAPLTLRAPLAKSSAIRFLLAAALAGKGGLQGAPPQLPRDVRIMTRGLETLGAEVLSDEDGLAIRRGIEFNQPGDRVLSIDALDAGTPARFLVAAAALTGAQVTIRGTNRLSERPLEGLLDSLETLGARVEASRSRSGSGRCFPVTVQGPLRHCATLRVDAAETSQFLSALLLIAPAIERGRRPGSMCITAAGLEVSTPYVDLTRSIMAHFGVEVSASGKVSREAQYVSSTMTAEVDWSGASILFAASAFAARRVVVPALCLESPHPDRAVVGILEHLGLTLCEALDGVEASGSVRCGGTFDMRACPDAVPAVAALAALAPEPVEVVGVSHLRLKESDRLGALLGLLRAVGAKATITQDGLRVSQPMKEFPAGADPISLDVQGDHRMAMVAALLGMRRPVLIQDARCVDKSFPGFWGQWPGVS